MLLIDNGSVHLSGLKFFSKLDQTQQFLELKTSNNLLDIDISTKNTQHEVTKTCQNSLKPITVFLICVSFK
jgi:short-subunit dehydrogenase